MAKLSLTSQFRGHTNSPYNSFNEFAKIVRLRIRVQAWYPCKLSVFFIRQIVFIPFFAWRPTVHASSDYIRQPENYY